MDTDDYVSTNIYKEFKKMLRNKNYIKIWYLAKWKMCLRQCVLSTEQNALALPPPPSPKKNTEEHLFWNILKHILSRHYSVSTKKGTSIIITVYYSWKVHIENVEPTNYVTQTVFYI